jgi:hypothetical protein
MSDDFYSLVQRRIWTDARFRKLSKPAPNARDLFLYLLTSPHASQLPGLIALGESAMAEDLEWPVAGLRKCLVELETASMVKVDRVSRLLWMPNALKHNPPRSPDNVKGWTKHWRLLPECGLLAEAAAVMMTAFVERGKTFAEAFSKVSGTPIPEAQPTPKGDPKEGGIPDPMGGAMVGAKGAPSPPTIARPSPQHQIQDQDQDQKSHTHSAGAHAHETRTKTGTMAKVEDLVRLLRESPALAPLAADERAVELQLGAFHMSHGDAATAALAQVAISRLAGREGRRLDGAPLDALAERLGTYLTDPRLRERAAASGPGRAVDGPLAQDVREALHLFSEAWEASKKRPFLVADGDERHAERLVAAARRSGDEHAAARPEIFAVIRHWSRSYLRDGSDKMVNDREHPLALLPSRISTYGLPKSQAEKPAPKLREQEEPLVPPPADLRALAATMGRGGAL